MIKVKLKNVKREIEKAETLLLEEAKIKSRVKAMTFLEDLKAATPIKTGRARRSWRLRRIRSTTGKEFVIEITNNTSYIDDLNRGSSRQAPPRFIELTALQHFTVTGAINVRP